ncbi:MAG: LacI family DNA-binding transcriptional regulator [Rhodospirillales bacterium]|nr:LacI family DNA-binding transcriptional regulator [Rhodospirillales bacterium]
MAVTLKDVAERAGVSRSAVSRTFTEGASVSEKMRAKVLKVARELDYSPSLIARSLATSRTKLIGLVANNYQNPIFLEVFDLYTRALQEKGLRPLIVNLTDESDPQALVRMLQQYNVDGVIIATSTLPPGFLKAFKDTRVPVVHTFGRANETLDFHIVGIDNVRCGEMAAQALFDHGYRDVAFLGGPKTATSTQDRLIGFERKSKKIGLRNSVTRFADNYSYDAGARAIEMLLNEFDVEAVFCGDDLICMGAMDAARERGIAVPEELGFIGFNDMDMANWSAYRLTTIRQPLNDLILKSIDLIDQLVDDPDRPTEVILFPCKLIKRRTLKPIRA